MSSGADQQCKVWNAATREPVASFKFDGTRDRMQIGGVITESGHAVSVSKVGIDLCSLVRRASGPA